jgi:hypothetical protein
VNRRPLAEIVNRQVSLDELRDALERPIDEHEREEILSLVRWFTRRYPSPVERLAYVRHAYARWSRRAPEQ